MESLTLKKEWYVLELSITQQPQSGFLGGPRNKSLIVCMKQIPYNVSISQLGKREIYISSPTGIYEDAISIYYSLVTLLMLFDGCFYPVVKAFDGADITKSWNMRSLPNYVSADFMLDASNKLLEFDSVLDETLFQHWCSIKQELDIVHNMVLYCLSSVEMPKDMQCAFMVESFKGVCELIHSEEPSFVLPLNTKKKLELKPAFLAILDKYGTDVFSEELNRNREEFVRILVKSRNRIAHIKSEQGQTYLDGGESVMYLMKLSLLYRIVLFDLLGIPKKLYNASLISRVQRINDHIVMKSFLASLS